LLKIEKNINLTFPIIAHIFGILKVKESLEMLLQQLCNND